MSEAESREPGTEDKKGPSPLVVRIPAGIRSKQKLLAILADKLRFPAYFGWNWDALEECLGDLSWLPVGQSVAIVHEALPFGAGGENRQIYLAILAAATPPGRTLHVVLPAADSDSGG
ncbi:MAG: barstar family protein [Pirellulaceae bacterium]